MNKYEFDNVIKLTPLERYRYFIKKVADNEFIYLLFNKEGDIAISELDGYIMLPVWSATEFAESCKINGWEYFTIREIPLDDFIDEWYEIIDNNEYLINVFPINDVTGFVVSLNEFKLDLEEELDKYY